MLAQQVSAQDLAGAVEQSFNNSPNVSILLDTQHIADAELGEAYGKYFPKVDVAGSFAYDYLVKGVADPSYTYPLTGKATLSYAIFDGLEARHSVVTKVAKQKASSLNINASLQAIALEVIKAYLSVLSNERLVKYAKENLEAHNKIYSQIEKKSDVGVGKVIDLDQAKGRIALARTSLISAQANLLDAKTKFTILVGHAPDGLSLPIFPAASLPETEEAAVAIALSSHPAIKASQKGITAAKAEYGEAKASLYPKLTAEGSGSITNKDYYTTPAVYDTNVNAALKLSYSFDGVNSGTANKLAKKVFVARDRQLQAQLQIEEAVRLAWSEFSTAKAQLKYFEEHSNSSSRVKDAYLKQFALGQRTLLDLLDSENEYFKSRSSFLDAKFQELLGKYKLLSSMGMLDKTLQIALPAEACHS